MNSKQSLRPDGLKQSLRPDGLKQSFHTDKIEKRLLSIEGTSGLLGLLRRYKRLSIGGGIFVAALLIITSGIRPTIEAIDHANRALEEAKVKHSKLSEKEAFLRSLNRQTLTSQAKKLDEAIPPIINLPLILATMQKIAEETEVELGEFSISSNTQVVTALPIEQADKLSSFQFRVNLLGGFGNVQRFIERLGNVLPFLRMESTEFSQDKTKATLLFFFQPKAVVAKLAPDAPLLPMSDRHKKAISDVFSFEPPVLAEPQIASPASESDRQSPFR